jgi:hypothetical protein
MEQCRRPQTGNLDPVTLPSTLETLVLSISNASSLETLINVGKPCRFHLKAAPAPILPENHLPLFLLSYAETAVGSISLTFHIYISHHCLSLCLGFVVCRLASRITELNFATLCHTAIATSCHFSCLYVCSYDDCFLPRRTFGLGPSFFDLTSMFISARPPI